MSTRERWIVYPLLFLTLGIVMRDKIVPQKAAQPEEIVAARVRCGQLEVDQAICGQLQVRGVVAVPGIKCAELAIEGPNRRPTVLLRTDPRTGGGVVATLSATGIPLVCLQPTETGAGVIVTNKGARPAEKPKAGDPTQPPGKAPDKTNKSTEPAKP